MTRSLRIAHISDTHLGYRALPHQDPLTGRNQRSVDVERSFSAAVDDILRQEVDLVLHAGDVFHQSRPNWHAVRHFVMEWRRIEAAGIPSVVIAGNHDTPRYRAGGSVFSVLEVALPHTRISAGYEEEEITFDELGIRVQTVPHGALTNPDKPVGYAVPEFRNILLIHGMLPGILPSGHVTEPGEQELDTELFEPDFAYIALGHYHIHTSPVSGAWYAGS
ncbi:MAG TPA: DNA repair exonuclease, partial [Thermomicrobiales bacterium]|nr:DNA repair exonuclease [Thermomicrobiales bacterium]